MFGLPEFVGIPKNAKIAVGLSGGVDSAVAAYLLKKQNFDVVGVHMQCWDYSDETCRGNEDRSDAVAICGQLGIKFVFLNFEKEYEDKVISYFYNEYKAGRTPNPDILCNKEIKFGLFLNWAINEGFDYIATGHYARVERAKLLDGGEKSYEREVDKEKNFSSEDLCLLKGVDDSKDQSYFLYRLSQKELSKVIFPVGGLLKSQVREIAEDANLIVAKKPDSMGICFVGKVNLREFLKRRIAEKEGPLVLKSTGEVIGVHSGVWFYTIGQRHGFKVEKYVGLPLYVVGKDIEQNILFVGYYNDCLSDKFKVSDVCFVREDLKDKGLKSFECGVRIRHLGAIYEALVERLSFDFWEVRLKNDKIFAVSPGQSAVFYRGDEVLGGGIIV